MIQMENIAYVAYIYNLYFGCDFSTFKNIHLQHIK
jgi:hypothetical protein